MNSNEIRDLFLRFFEEKGHTVLPSSSLVPHGDPTLLLTSAGMVQMKPYFVGEATPPNRRLATSQKCFRTTDIDCVGDAGHLTFFEMLGNFSIGDYFKKESIEWAWEFVTERLNLPKERLWITVFLDDDEAEGYWLELGVTKDHILRCDEKDNFWGPAGETGPCGPCSEIHYDFGEGFGCGSPDCGPSCDCDRFSEIWNLVFTELDQDAEGNRTPLKQKNIDTGMGLERTAALMQGKSTVYETDLFTPIIDRISELTGRKYGQSDEVNRAMRVIAEHTRAAAFLIADGVIPSNDGRGYVLRRILRRAEFFVRQLLYRKHAVASEHEFISGADSIPEAFDRLSEAGKIQDKLMNNFRQMDPFLSKVVDVVIEKMKWQYQELEIRREYIKQVVTQEELKFRKTLLDFEPVVLKMATIHNLAKIAVPYEGPEQSYQFEIHVMSYVRNEFVHDLIRQLTLEPFKDAADKGCLAEMQPGMVSGEEIFALADTHGFPAELTAEILREQDLEVDLERYESLMEAQRARAREAQKFGLADRSGEQFYESLSLPVTEFVGYDKFSIQSQVVGIVVDGELVETAFQGQEVEVILAATPFYGEKGGQVGDTGEIQSEKGKIVISDAQKPIDNLVVHIGKVEEGVISVNDPVEVKVDRERRLDIARNHTATHLLHAALRKVLGDQVKQGGSFVAPDHFRFDYTHLVAMSKEELAEVQKIVNENIRRSYAVSGREMPYQQAVEAGALAFFGEKYGDVVRMVEIGSEDRSQKVSAELCGGTHLRNTGEIGFFHITSEKSIGSGLRRIEAVTGRGAEALAEERISVLENVASQLEANSTEAAEKLALLLSEFNAERKRAKELEGELLRKTAESLLLNVTQVDGVNVLAGKIEASNMELMRETGDWLKDKLGSAVIVLGVVLDNNPRFLAMVTPDLVGKGIHAGKIIKQVAQVAGGGGGGKPDMAQAGGKDKSKIDEALKLVPDLIGK